MSCAGAAGVTGGFEASGGSPDPLRPKRPAGLGGTAQLSKWRLGKHNLDLIGLSDTVECIKTGEAVKGIGALWESAAGLLLQLGCRCHVSVFGFHSQLVKTK